MGGGTKTSLRLTTRAALVARMRTATGEARLAGGGHHTNSGRTRIAPGIGDQNSTNLSPARTRASKRSRASLKISASRLPKCPEFSTDCLRTRQQLDDAVRVLDRVHHVASQPITAVGTVLRMPSASNSSSSVNAG